MEDLPDNDSQETKEWLDALESVLDNEGPERAHYLISQLIERQGWQESICHSVPTHPISTPFHSKKSNVPSAIMTWNTVSAH